MTPHLGTGVIIAEKGIEYMLTSAHLAYEAGYNPLVNINGEWTDMRWEFIGGSKSADLAVLRRKDKRARSPLPPPPLANASDLRAGQPAIAAGFPGTDMPIKWIYCAKTGRPKPISAPLTLYPSDSAMQHAAGYLTYGFSGGPIIARSNGAASVAGVVADKHTVSGKTPEAQHAGLLRYSPAAAAREIIERYNRSAPRTKDARAPRADNPLDPAHPIMLTANIEAATLMLGADKPRC